VVAAQVAGDDLALPFAVGALLRAVGLGILVAFAFSFATDITCPSVTCPWLALPGVGCIVGYVALSVALMAATALLEAGIAMSSKGAIMDDLHKGVMGAGIVCLQRPTCIIVVRVGREEEGVRTKRRRR